MADHESPKVAISVPTPDESWERLVDLALGTPADLRPKADTFSDTSPKPTPHAVGLVGSGRRGSRGRLPHDWDMEGEEPVDLAQRTPEEVATDERGFGRLREQAAKRYRQATIDKAKRDGIPPNALLRARGLPLLAEDETDV